MGSKIIFYTILKPISYLPFRVLYLLSDFIFILVYQLVGYRKKVVLENMRNSFPEKSEEEVAQLAKKFYRHFCDLVVESVKGFSITRKQLIKRMVFENTEVVQKLFDDGRDIIVAGGHYNNWELCGFAVPVSIPHTCIGIYAPLSDRFFDKVMKKSREKYGLVLCPMKKTKAYFEADFGQPKATFFIADQSPARSKNVHWMDFLNQDTPVFTGAERYAKMYNQPLLFLGVTKLKRGYYTARFELLFDKPNETQEHEITEKINRKIEQQILTSEEFWLWTHRRWKRKRETS